MTDTITASELLESARSLPPLPQGVSQLLALSPDSSSYLEDSGAIIRADAALGAEVIRLANSALYSGQTVLDSIEQALIRVGPKNVVGMLALHYLKESLPANSEILGQVWRTQILSALICRSLVERSPAIKIDAETAYTYGLLHDVGRLLLAAAFPQRLERIHERRPHPTWELREDEKESLDFDHCEAGRLIGGRWKFSSEITLVIVGHHLPLERREDFPDRIQLLIDLVTLGDLLTHALQDETEISERLLGRIDAELSHPLATGVVRRLGVKREEMDASLEPSLRQLGRLLRFLGISEGKEVVGAEN